MCSQCGTYKWAVSLCYTLNSFHHSIGVNPHPHHTWSVLKRAFSLSPDIQNSNDNSLPPSLPPFLSLSLPPTVCVLGLILHIEYQNVGSTSKVRTFFLEVRPFWLILTTSKDWGLNLIWRLRLDEGAGQGQGQGLTCERLGEGLMYRCMCALRDIWLPVHVENAVCHFYHFY